MGGMALPAPTIPHPVRIAFANARTGAPYALESVDDASRFGPHAAAQVAAVCSEPLIYERLFRQRLDGHPYDATNGLGFLTWAESHWRENTAFVFVITHPLDGIVGALDIKSTNRDEAEIGYWLSARHGGVMTNAVRLMRDLAWAAGFRALFAVTDPDNARSQAVLARAGFVHEGSMTRNGETYWLHRLRGV
jgi:RimJ/RimL family protein N-acetyltransferase